MPNDLWSLDYASMALLGLFGAGHCVGMCGPLVIALPGRAGGVLPHLCYHAGRAGTYTCLGILLGALGGAVAHLGAVARLQVGLSGLAALFLLLFGLVRIGLVPEPALLRVPNATLGAGFARAQQLARDAGPIGMVPLGALNGLLPCGLSYAALSRALPAGGPLQGGLLVAAFGLGTLPALLLLGTAAGTVLRRHRAIADVLAGVLMIAMAVDLGAGVVLAR
ncbi:MAG: sulfite exporter TauE/SafE family protein [Planctomycetes bacterium]|nr:sulfite exporter TauE/SafE family protein [Planctomycetota bacterium]